MIISTQVTFKEYLKLLFTLTYKKPMMRVILGIACVMLLWITGYYCGVVHIPKPGFYQYIPLAIITVVQPLVIYNTISNNYYSSSPLTEKLQIEFTNEQIKITGESFYTELRWQKTHKVQELNTWFLIYQNSLSAIIIPKKCLHHQLDEFKHFLQALPEEHLQLKSLL